VESLPAQALDIINEPMRRVTIMVWRIFYSMLLFSELTMAISLPLWMVGKRKYYIVLQQLKNNTMVLFWQV
jgi:hypothetical protein